MVAWTQLLLLACMIAVSASLTCDDITCCSGWVCDYMAPGASGQNFTKCVQATSCDQLDCPRGQVCVSEPRGFGAPPKVSCQASCDAVQCPDFLQCVETVSGTKCVIPNDCLLVECPFGTNCKMQQIGNKMAAVCLGESCDSTECFNGSECFEFTADQALDFLAGKKRKSRTNTDTTSTRTSGSGDAVIQVNTSSLVEMNYAVCLPTCEGADVCPPGLVCEIDKYSVVCREPESCEELECPVGQECQEVKCEHGRAHGRTKSNSKRSTGTKTSTSTKSTSRKNVLLECVDIEPESGSGMEVLLPTIATTTEEPFILERVDDSQNALLGNSAHSLIASASVLALLMCAYSLLVV